MRRSGCGAGSGLWRRSGASRVSGAAVQPLVALPITPTARWNAQYSNVVESGGKVTNISDIQSLAAASDAGTGAGPVLMTDALGRKFLRFEGAAYLTVAAAFAAASRACTVIMVGRIHKGYAVAIERFFALSSAAGGNATNGGQILNKIVISATGGPYIYCGSIGGYTDATNGKWTVPGTQLSVIGTRSAATAGGGGRVGINKNSAAVAQTSISTAVLAGAEIGRNPASPGSSGTWARFDLYDMAVYNTALTNAEFDAAMAAMTDGWNIAQITNQLVLEGDSITDGITDVTSGMNLAMVATEPGSATAMPAGWRVVHMGVSGNQTSATQTKRDATNTIYNQLLPGRNVVAYQIGRNNVGAGAQTGAQAYAAIVALLNTSSTGLLQRGWEVRQAINIASSTLQTQIDALRTALRASTFLTDCDAGPGQTYDGKLSRIELPFITKSGVTLFDTAANSLNLTYYQNDVTHPSIAGTAVMWAGGDTPAYGYAGSL